jgi:outer membrane protein TolC
VQLTKQAEEVARKSFEEGTISRQALLAASADVRAVEIAYARLTLDLAELQVTAAPPRDELWAPLVASRDFVKERLQMEGTVAQQRLRDAETKSAEVDRAFSVGTTGRAEVSDALLDVSEAKLAFNRIVTRINLREQFLKEDLTPEEVTRRLERMDTMLELQHMQSRLASAEATLQRARERVEAGLATRAFGLRAELEVLEVQEQIEKLRLRLATIDGRGR